MKEEYNYYILKKRFMGHDIYLTADYAYAFSICDALKTANKAGALAVKNDYENRVRKKTGLEAVPLKITYECG